MGFACCDVRSCRFCVKRFGDKQFGLVVHFWRSSSRDGLVGAFSCVSCAHSLAAKRTQNTQAPSRWISIWPPCSAQWCWLFEPVRTVLYVHDALSNFQVFQYDNWEFGTYFWRQFSTCAAINSNLHMKRLYKLFPQSTETLCTVSTLTFSVNLRLTKCVRILADLPSFFSTSAGSLPPFHLSPPFFIRSCPVHRRWLWLQNDLLCLWPTRPCGD